MIRDIRIEIHGVYYSQKIMFYYAELSKLLSDWKEVLMECITDRRHVAEVSSFVKEERGSMSIHSYVVVPVYTQSFMANRWSIGVVVLIITMTCYDQRAAGEVR